MKKVQVVVSLILAMSVALCGCAGLSVSINPSDSSKVESTAQSHATTSSSKSSSSSASSSSPASSSEIKAQSTAQAETGAGTANEEEKGVNSEGVTVPAFLTEEQQAAYKNAHYALFWLYDVPGNLTEHGFSYAGENGVQITTADGYTLCNESYDKFVEYAHSIFTDDFLSGNEYYTKKFKSADGKLAMLESMIKPVVPGDWQQVEEDYPDTFRKESASDTKVVFRLISHYDANAKTTDTSNWSKEKMKVETIEYNITMVKENGAWKFSEFHSTMFG